MTKSSFLGLGLLVIGSLSTQAMADSFKCGNDTDKSNARWFVQVSQTREAGVGRKPGFFLLTNAKADGTIVSTDDRRRIALGGEEARGITYTVKLNEEELRSLSQKADQRVNLDGAARVTVKVDAELNQDYKDGAVVAGAVAVTNEEGEEIYTTALSCTYDDASDDKK